MDSTGVRGETGTGGTAPSSGGTAPTAGENNFNNKENNRMADGANYYDVNSYLRMLRGIPGGPNTMPWGFGGGGSNAGIDFRFNLP